MVLLYFKIPLSFLTSTVLRFSLLLFYFSLAAYFEQGEFNIISVDWGILAQPPCYMESSENVYVVAECAAEFLDSLYAARSELDINNTHIIGHSLGAQIAGLMGNNLVTGKVPRVTGW